MRLLRRIAESGFEAPERQVEIFDAEGDFIGRIDVGWRRRRVGSSTTATCTTISASGRGTNCGKFGTAPPAGTCTGLGSTTSCPARPGSTTSSLGSGTVGRPDVSALSHRGGCSAREHRDVCTVGLVFGERVAAARTAMVALDIDLVLLSVGPDLPYLTGYTATATERLTMLVLPAEGDATLVVPRLEAPRVHERPEVFGMAVWDETDDPVELVGRLAGSPATAAIGDTTWARFLVDLLAELPSTRFRRAGEVMAPLRARKDPGEIASLRSAAAAADRVAAVLQAGGVPLVGRTEAEVAADVDHLLVDEGHARAEFAIVAAGEHAASPHHEPSSRVIRAGEVVLFDFGGAWIDDQGLHYFSDTTRCVWTGGADPPAEFRDLYTVLRRAQAEAVDAATVGTPAEDVDAVARRVITDAGYGPHFVHRTGHGIGLEVHEDPYLVGGNCDALAPGNAFSVEPGIYIDGRWGARVEDIVVASDAGPDPLNRSDHELAVVDA
jgi:Xaa-Pro aminopeptidase